MSGDIDQVFPDQMGSPFHYGELSNDADLLPGSEMLNLEPPEVPSPTFPCARPASVMVDNGLSVSLFRDIRDTSAVAGVAGLRNLGNTCFMNAGLQCLMSNARLVKYFLEEFECSEDVKTATLTGKFFILLAKFWSGRFSLLHPSEFKKIVGIYHPQFRDHRQHDCQEFLALLLDSLHEYLNEHHSLKADCEPSELFAMDDLSHSDCSDVELDENSVKHVDNATNGLHIVDNSLSFNEGSVIETAKAAEESASETNKPAKESEESQVEDSEDTRVVEESMDFDTPQSVDAHCKIPSIEDFSKDTKTLNTNMLVMEASDVLATDSDKFHKPNNMSERHSTSMNTEVAEDDDDEGAVDGQLQDLLAAACDGAVMKPVKETNLVANCRDKFVDDFDSYPLCLKGTKLSAFDGLTKMSTECFPNGTKPFMRAATCLSEIDDCETAEHHDINNIKRIKIDDQAEKNLRMQTKLKVNTEQNCTRASPSAECSSMTNSYVDHIYHGLSSAASAPADQQPHPQLAAVSSWGGGDQHHHAYYVRSADKAWREYSNRNRSVIVRTFQGQFKSTVICSECNHMSVTFEPFMYLSVPLPHALERQLSIIFVPCDNKQPVRFLLNLHRQDTVKHLRSQLVKVLGEDESCDLVIAEVLDNHIARVLEDHVQLKFVNDIDRTVYAFEMLPPPVIENQEDVCVHDSDAPECATNNFPSPATAATSTLNSLVTDDGRKPSTSSAGQEADDVFASDLLNNRVEPTAVENCAAQLELNPDVNWQHNEFKDADAVAGCSSNGFSLVDEVVRNDENAPMGMWSGSSPYDLLTWEEDQANATSKVLLNDASGSSCDLPGWEAQDNVDDEMQASGGLSCPSELLEGDVPSSFDMEETAGAGSADTGKPLDGGCEDEETAQVADKWRSCKICLDDMEDSALKVHTAPACAETLCHTCLETSLKHLPGICPVCRESVNPEEDFVQLNCMDNYKPKTRMLSVPIVNRYNSCSKSCSGEGQTIKLFGHPNVLYLPSKLTGSLLYQTVDRVVPCLANYYSIVVTDGQGYRCSRCLYTQHCTGCELPRDSSEIDLHPGDHLAVQFTDLTNAQMDSAFRFADHDSMKLLRPSEPLTLYDCFQAFAESELLDEHNPWFCPKCRKNQCASKTMSVWRYPDTLVVHLKRFVYHELSSTKIDNKVVFPLEGLDLSDYITGPATSELIYDLQSCVCHFGGANSGHYTAYSRHPVGDEWFYSNDETVVKQTPHDADYSSAYILFYQRRGTDINFQLSHISSYLGDDDDEAAAGAADSLEADLKQAVSSLASSVTVACGSPESGQGCVDIVSTKSEFDFYQ